MKMNPSIKDCFFIFRKRVLSFKLMSLLTKKTSYDQRLWETNKKGRKTEKKEGVLKSCLLFSFFLFGCFQIIVDYRKFFLLQIWSFFFERFRTLEILNCTFVCTLGWISVCVDTGSNLVLILLTDFKNVVLR